ncbi:hypothetical protein PHLCEN_2v10903 [Hermanssonia centrifuga]|uniref:Peroxisomal biogenesis factor 3 n=1 Tax=Hermanssonia centrifuga TaxID=98765 RepID=A0A2R6NLQ3_9APHY|nr:hypothetical protein PHLCEN_2v10903 [Hermanssonia centrifuga]
MFQTLTNYFNAQRPRVARAAGYAGAVYLVGRYVGERLEEVRNRLLHDRMARENLRRRFEQNQQDVSFTIMALLPTLGAHILEGMDVEGVTQELQAQSRASKAPYTEPTPPPPPLEQSSVPSIEIQSAPEQDARSENESVSVVSYPDHDDTGSSSNLGASSQSWVENFSSQQSQLSPETSSVSADESRLNADSPKSSIVGTDISDSIMTSSSAVSYGDTQSAPWTMESSPIASFTRSKAELWKEVKMLTFTRTLTILYSMTLLSLFTHIQLNILGRSKYIQAILQLAEDEVDRERLQDSLSLAALFWNGNLASAEVDGDLQNVEAISEEIERKYLTLSWWILHVGWKDVGERVRRAVEEVFEGVSLKTKLAASDLHRLISDVRRRVEFEVTFEGTERRINFTSTLLPPTSETLQHVLTQGGIPPRLAAVHDPSFLKLLEETRTQLCSGSFELVLEVCLDKATELLFNGLEKNVFGGSTEWDDPNSSLGLTQEPRVRLAGMLPGLARWCHLALQGLPNELVDGLGDTREVKAFSAIIYSNYEDQFQ